MRLSILLILMVIWLLSACNPVCAEPDYTRVSFQGKLATAAGAPVPDGTYDIVFKFYDAPSAGTLLLTDRHVAGSNPVEVRGGLYTVLLGGGTIVAGSESSLRDVFLNHQDVYLGVTVSSEAEMTPRIPLTRAPYAIRADDALTVAGKSASQLLGTSSAPQTKSGSLVISGASSPTPLLDITNNQPSGIGIQSTVTSSNAAVVAANKGSGAIITGQSGPSSTPVFEVANNGSTTISGNATIAGSVAASGGYKYNSVKVGRVNLGPSDFVPRDPYEHRYILWGYPEKPNRHYMVNIQDPLPLQPNITLHAQVHVPDGVTLTKLVCYICDQDPAKTSSLSIARCSLLGNSNMNIATINSIDGTGNIRLEAPLSEVVNAGPPDYYYFVLSLQLYNSDLGMQFMGAQVEYTYNELKN